MKDLKALLSIILACTLLCGCQTKESHVTSYDDGYTDGYEKGYSVGYEEGEIDTRSSIEYKYEKATSKEIEEAISILRTYSDEGLWADPSCEESVNDEELKWAAEIVSYYWCDIENLIYED